MLKVINFQSVTPNLSLGGEVFWAGQHRKSGIGYAARFNTDKMVWLLEPLIITSWILYTYFFYFWCSVIFLFYTNNYQFVALLQQKRYALRLYMPKKYI